MTPGAQKGAPGWQAWFPVFAKAWTSDLPRSLKFVAQDKDDKTVAQLTLKAYKDVTEMKEFSMTSKTSTTIMLIAMEDDDTVFYVKLQVTIILFLMYGDTEMKEKMCC